MGSDAVERGLLLDTSVWFWYALGDRRLRSTLRTALDDAQPNLWLSPISIWELGVLLRRGRIHLRQPFAAWVRTVLDRLPLRDAHMTREVAIATESLRLEHHDPADRVIAATALAYRLQLATSDRKLVAADWLPTVS